MKKQIIIPLALAILCSCNSNNNTSNSKKDTAQNVSTSKTSRRQVTITDGFNQITSLGGIDIIYNQGDYNIELEGDSTLFNSVKAIAESGILTLYFSTDNNPELNYYGNERKLTAHISSPDLKCVALCSNGNFKSESKWKIDELSLGIIGSGNFDLDSVECNIFKYEATGDGNATFKHIDSKESIFITCMNESDVTADINTNSVNIATQKGKVVITGKATKKDIVAVPRTLVTDKTTR